MRLLSLPAKISVKGTLAIPSKLGEYPVTAIGDEAFAFLENLKGVKIPNGVKTIGEYVFVYCDKLKSVTIGTGAKTIGEGAFADCGALNSITVPKNVKNIGKNAFGYSFGERIEGFKIKGTKGSAAEKYARQNDMKFVAV